MAAETEKNAEKSLFSFSAHSNWIIFIDITVATSPWVAHIVNKLYKCTNTHTHTRTHN